MKKSLAIGCIFALLTSVCFASAIEQFKQFLHQTQSAKGEFAQVQVLQKEDKKQMRLGKTSSGTFVFLKPGKFIWTYKKPYEQILQSDGKMLYIYDKDLNQVTTKKLDHALGASPAAILFGSTDIEKNFVLKEDGTRNDMQWMIATPKDKDSTFESINIGMQNNVPLAMELHDALGQISLIKLLTFEKNPPLRGDQFKFTIPKGADVFEN